VILSQILWHLLSFAHELVWRIDSSKLTSLLHNDCPDEKWAPRKLWCHQGVLDR
jgi:hypothetical protein